MNKKLYAFIKEKSDSVPVAIIRTSLIKHGYSLKDVDEAARKVLIEQRTAAKLNKKSELFTKFSHESIESSKPVKRFETVGKPKPSVGDGYVPLESIVHTKVKTTPKSAISSLAKMSRDKPRVSFSHEVEHHKDNSNSFISLSNIRVLGDSVSSGDPELASSISSDPIKAIRELAEFSDLPLDKHAPTIETIATENETDHQPTTFSVLKEKIRMPKMSFALRFKVFKSVAKQTLNEIDKFKLIYLIIVITSVLAILTTLIFPRYQSFAIKVVLCSVVILMLAHNLMHLEKKYGLERNEKNAFELAVIIGLAGWLLAMTLNPLYILVLLVPGVFFFSVMVKEVYHTSMQIALKISALTAIATFFAFYGISIIMGVLVGIKAIL